MSRPTSFTHWLSWILLLLCPGWMFAEGWTERHPAQEGGELLWSITDGAAGMVAVGDNGRLLHSADGLAWQRVDSGTDVWLVGVTYGSGHYIAVGASGTILRSQDGRTWSRAAQSGTTARLNNVLYAQDKFVAVGERGTILNSADGETWSATPSGVAGWLHGLAYGGDLWITVGESGAVASSPDGANWTVRPVGTSQHLEAVVFGSKVQQQFNDGSESITATFLAVGAGGTALPLVHHKSNTAGNNHESFYGWAHYPASYPGLPPTDVRLGSLAVYDGLYIATGDNGTVLTAQSEYGPWTVVDVGTDRLLNASGFGNGSLYLAGEGEVILQSPPIFPSRLGNISTRGEVGTGAAVMIAGTIVDGDLPKQFLVRGVGPTLASEFDLSGALSKPVLTIYDAAGAVVASNDGWEKNPSPEAIAAAAEQVGAFALANDQADAALVVTLDPGIYTFMLSGADNSTGVALIEAYDMDEFTGTSSRTINISTRGTVGTGDQTMIAGLVVQGPSARNVLIRGVGPTLSEDFEVPGAVEDPVITVFDAAGEVVASNDDWSTPSTVFGREVPPEEIAAAAGVSGAFPLAEGSKDSALLLRLIPGSYTIHVSGKDGSTGVALVEAYDVPVE